MAKTYWDQLSHADRVRIMGEAAMAAIEHKRVANLNQVPATSQKCEITGWIYTPAPRKHFFYESVNDLSWRDRYNAAK